MKATLPHRETSAEDAAAVRELERMLARVEAEAERPRAARPMPSRGTVHAWVRREITGNRIVAIVAWCVGVLTTYLGFVSMLPGIPLALAAGVALVSQAILTWMERGIWRGRHLSVVTVAALLFDVLLNAGGVYPYALRIGATPTAQMLADAFHWQSTISPIGAMILALVIGFLIAAAPEEFWSRRD